MPNRFRVRGALAAVAAAILLAACANPFDRAGSNNERSVGSVEIQLNGIGSQSIIPVVSELVEQYVVTLTASGQTTVTQAGPQGEKPTQDITFTNLAPVTWSITVDALDAEKNVIGRGTGAVTVVPGSKQDVPISVRALQSGTGSFGLRFLWPEALADGAEVTITDQNGEPLGSAYDVERAAGAVLVSSTEPVGSGSYTLAVRLIRDKQPVATVIEALQIFDNVETTASIEVGAAEIGQAPLAPANVRVTSSSLSSIAIAWDDLANTEQSYEIGRSVNGGAVGWIATVGANATSYTDTSGFVAESSYRYSVRAVNGYGTSSAVQSAAVTPAGPVVLVSPANRAEVAPRGIILDWQPYPGATGYNVFLDTATAPKQLLASVTATQVSLEDYGFQANLGTTYYWRVEPIGAGLASPTRSFTPVPPTRAKAAADYAIDTTAGARSVRLGDLDEDGDDDAVALFVDTKANAWQVLVFQNRSEESPFQFGSGVRIALGEEATVLPANLRLGDFDADGDLDIVHGGDRLAVYLNRSEKGSISFAAAEPVPSPYDGGYGLVEVGEFAAFQTETTSTADDVLAVELNRGAPVVSWYVGIDRSTTPLRAQTDVRFEVYSKDNGGVSEGGITSLASVVGEEIPQGMVIVGQNDGGAVSLRTIVPTAAFRDGYRDVRSYAADDLQTYKDATGPAFADSGDQTGDGVADVVALGPTLQLLQWFDPRIDANSAIGPVNATDVPDPQSINVVDMDGDSIADVLVPDAASGVAAFLANPGKDGALGQVETVAAEGVSDVDAADIDGDGYPDLVVASASAGLIVFDIWE